MLGIGGLGHVALQLSRACGFETIAITHSADKRDLAIGLGADRVVANGAELRDLGGADVLLVTTNEFSTAEAMTGVRVDGRVILCGADFSKPFSIASQRKPFHMMRQQVISSTHGGLRYLSEVLDLAAKGAKFRAVVRDVAAPRKRRRLRRVHARAKPRAAGAGVRGRREKRAKLPVATLMRSRRVRGIDADADGDAMLSGASGPRPASVVATSAISRQALLCAGTSADHRPCPPGGPPPGAWQICSPQSSGGHRRPPPQGIDFKVDVPIRTPARAQAGNRPRVLSA